MNLRSLILRYSLMIVLAIFMDVFYVIFAPLTIYPVYFLLGMFYPALLNGAILTVNGVNISIINACIAGSAFYLLFILNFSTPGIRLKKRFLILLLDYALFLILNIIRIFILSLLLINNSSFFYFIHLIFWYAVSIVLVAAIWLFTVKIFKIRKIPFLSDFILLWNKARK